MPRKSRWKEDTSNLLLNTTAVLGGLQETSCMPDHASGVDKMFHSGCDQLPAVLAEPELSLK